MTDLDQAFGDEREQERIEKPEPAKAPPKQDEEAGYNLAFAMAQAMAPKEELPAELQGTTFVQTVTQVGGRIMNMLQVPRAMEELGVGAGSMSPGARVAAGFGLTAAIAVLLRVKSRKGGKVVKAEGRPVPRDSGKREDVGNGEGAVPRPGASPSPTDPVGGQVRDSEPAESSPSPGVVPPPSPAVGTT